MSSHLGRRSLPAQRFLATALVNDFANNAPVWCVRRAEWLVFRIVTLASVAHSRLGQMAAVGVVIFAAAVVGIDSRLPGSLALLWPANAVLLSIMVRVGGARRHPEIWIAAAVGYLAADLSHGTNALAAVVLAAGNLSSVSVALLVLIRLDILTVRAATPSSILRLASACVAGCAVGASIGAVAAVRFFGGTWPDGWLSWFACELVNYACLLPVLLTVRRWEAASPRRVLKLLKSVAVPWLLLIALLVVAGLLRDNGSAVAFTIPALVAGALAGRFFVTALMVLTSTVSMLAMSVGVGVSAAPAPVSTTTQIALALLALGPLAVAAATAERRRLLDELREATIRDDLTGVLRRGEFSHRAQEMLDDCYRSGLQSAFLMMDLDHFKLLNDRRGHLAGDEALQGYGAILRDVLTAPKGRGGQQAVVGRVGGEEFAALLSDVTVEQARSLAEEIRSRQEGLARSRFGADGTTVSIGVACRSGVRDLDELMLAADTSVYTAKRRGRNSVVVTTDGLVEAVGD
jgi:diguanylate cyclase (GGDEF)-like protein